MFRFTIVIITEIYMVIKKSLNVNLSCKFQRNIQRKYTQICPSQKENKAAEDNERLDQMQILTLWKT